MITVRFPDGTSVQYNTATNIDFYDSTVRLTANGKWVADVLKSSGAVIEAVPACRVYNPTRSQSVRELVDALLSHRSPTWQEAHELSRLKAAMRSFNGRSKSWRAA